MNKYDKWMKGTNVTEEIIYELCDKDNVIINGQTYEGVINDANEWQKFVDIFLLVKKDVYSPYVGDTFIHKNNTYIIFYEPEERETYWSCKARLCNTTMFIPSANRPEIIEYDDFYNPIYADEIKDVEIPCVADKTLVYGQADMSNPINLPDNKVKVSIPYTDQLIDKFRLYGDMYKSRDIDKTQSLNGKGIITLTGERILDTDGNV